MVKEQAIEEYKGRGTHNFNLPARLAHTCPEKQQRDRRGGGDPFASIRL